MVHAILCGLFFGFVALFVGGIVAEGSQSPKELAGAFIGAGAMLGAIFGAIVGGTGAIVDAIKRNAPGAGSRAGKLSSKAKWIVAAVVILAAIVAMTAAILHGVALAWVVILAAIVAFIIYLVLRP